MSLAAHWPGTHPDFCSMKQLEDTISTIHLPSTGWGFSPALNSLVLIRMPGQRETVMKVKCLTQEHNTMPQPGL